MPRASAAKRSQGRSAGAGGSGGPVRAPHLHLRAASPRRRRYAAYGQGRAEVGLDQAKELARICVLNTLAAVKQVAGDLDRIARVVKVVGYVASAPDFTGQPGVVNGASELLKEVLGDKGVHARSAVGVAVLPLNAPLEVEIPSSWPTEAEVRRRSDSRLRSLADVSGRGENRGLPRPVGHANVRQPSSDDREWETTQVSVVRPWLRAHDRSQCRRTESKLRSCPVEYAESLTYTRSPPTATDVGFCKPSDAVSITFGDCPRRSRITVLAEFTAKRALPSGSQVKSSTGPMPRAATVASLTPKAVPSDRPASKPTVRPHSREHRKRPRARLAGAERIAQMSALPALSCCGAGLAWFQRAVARAWLSGGGRCCRFVLRGGFGGLGGGVVDGLALLGALGLVLGHESFECEAHDLGFDLTLGMLLFQCGGDFGGGAGLVLAGQVFADEVDEFGRPFAVRRGGDAGPSADKYLLTVRQLSPVSLATSVRLMAPDSTRPRKRRSSSQRCGSKTTAHPSLRPRTTGSRVANLSPQHIMNSARSSVRGYVRSRVRRQMGNRQPWQCDPMH